MATNKKVAEKSELALGITVWVGVICYYMSPIVIDREGNGFLLGSSVLLLLYAHYANGQRSLFWVSFYLVVLLISWSTAIEVGSFQKALGLFMLVLSGFCLGRKAWKYRVAREERVEKNKVDSTVKCNNGFK